HAGNASLDLDGGKGSGRPVTASDNSQDLPHTACLRIRARVGASRPTIGRSDRDRGAVMVDRDGGGFLNVAIRQTAAIGSDCPAEIASGKAIGFPRLPG